MAHKRSVIPKQLPEGRELTAAMAGIGMNFAIDAAKNPNIEDTIFAASMEGMERRDLRVLAILATWLGIHYERINADRLIKLVKGSDLERVKAFWSAFGSWKSKDRRFARLIIRRPKERIDVLRTGTDFHLKRHGEDPRFESSALRVPANVLRDRPSDVTQPAELARVHANYRWRIILGPSYRADAWAALEDRPTLTAAELARAAYGSFATAWQVRRDHELIARRS